MLYKKEGTIVLSKYSEVVSTRLAKQGIGGKFINQGKCDKFISNCSAPS